MRSKDSPRIWFEAFSLREDCGVRFPVLQVHQCGGILRVKLPGDEDWRQIPLNQDNDVQIQGKWYSDWCANSEVFDHFVEIPLEKIKKELDWL